jgi:broad specificity phosphatase PhoE
VLYVVRHGETAVNVAGLLLGRADAPLTERGIEQARSLAAALPAPDRLVSSPLRRARDTAAAFGRPVEVDERWIELDYGDFDGAEPASVPPEQWAEWRRETSALGIRVRAACADLVHDATAGTVVVVTHVSPVKAAVAWALGVDDGVAERMWVEDAAVARIDASAGGPVLRSFNEHPPPAP